MFEGSTDRDFTLRQLRTFVCAARAGSFSHAAAELGISQPAVSDQIALLEKRLGRTLFFRRLGTTPRLTPDGKTLLETADTLIDTSRAMRCMEARQSACVRLHIGPRALDLYLKPLLPSLYRDVPGLDIQLVPCLPPIGVQSALERGQVDLVVYTMKEMPQGWENSRSLGKVRWVLAGPPGIRQNLAAGLVRIDDLQFILPVLPDLPGSELERELSRLSIRPRKPIMSLEFPDVIQRMVEGGQGVTLLAYEQLADGIAAGRLETFGPELPPMRRVIARSNRAPSAARLVEERLASAMTTPGTACSGL